jgi:hypothetical protein
MVDQRQGASPPPVRVRLAPRFTSDGSCAIHELARRMPPGTPFDLDFSGVREFQEAAMLALARDVIAGKVCCVFRGLTRHQARLFGYLGVQAEPAQDFDDR